MSDKLFSIWLIGPTAAGKTTIAQIMYKNHLIAEITCPTKYFKEASSINFQRSSVYGIGVLLTSVKYFLTKIGIINWKILK